MGNLFSSDGVLYNICTVVYNLLLLNLLWFLFSLPVITMGASTTALFYITGKILRGEACRSIPLEFWQSFKLNFKEATIIFTIILLDFFILFTNITNIRQFGNLALFLYPLNLVLLLHLLVIMLFAFPLLSRYYLRVKDCFKLAVYFAYRHPGTTFLCLVVIPGIYLLISWNGGFYLLAMSLYSFWIYYLIKDKIEELANINAGE